jgi:hypothetical protein
LLRRGAEEARRLAEQDRHAAHGRRASAKAAKPAPLASYIRWEKQAREARKRGSPSDTAGSPEGGT